MAELGMELKSVWLWRHEKVSGFSDCIKYLYEEEEHEKTILKVTVECNLKTSRKIL